ncbi:MAG: hybrid sensor histidine kinase/response regulator, partial [Muribaculaceae bacterium]|nr:hybrid sensor histidine kinase/response regulator [Muribaculaceae bacterium]
IDLLAARARLIGNMPIGYSQATLLCGNDGKVTEIKYQGYNDTFRELLKRNELPDYPSGLFKEEEMAGIAEHLLKEKKTLRFSHHFDETDTDYEFLATITKDLGKTGYVVDIFAIDITDQKKKEQMLIEAREKARESDKLKMAFLANMSHEIRTPLNAIVGFSRLLPKTKDPAKQARFVETIDVNNELLLKLIGDILDTAKIESNTLDVHKEPTDVNSLLLSVDSTVRFRLKEGVKLNVELAEPECEIFTDTVRLRQVIINMLTNAIKFTDQGSITFGYKIGKHEIYFYVRDTGAGIAPENIDKLFTRFTKLNNFKQGNGLGLSISKSIIEKLGGKIGAESAGQGKGSLFWFTLPYPGTEHKQ